MVKETKDVLKAVGIAALFVAGMIAGIFIMSGNYKQGQVDAINGIIKYELVEQEDGHTEWGKVEKLSD